MIASILSHLLLYLYRYKVCYALFFVLLIGVLTVSVFVPRQLTNAEQTSAVKSATLSLSHPSTESILDAPYHLLQKASLYLFSITQIGIHIPSILTGKLPGWCICLFMRPCLFSR